jgi:hypothetical protein
VDGQVSTLQDVVYGFMPAQILHVGARLNIADELACGPRTLGELAAATGTHAPSLRRLLHGLACLDVLDETAAGYELTPAGEQLRSDVPNSIRAAVLLFCSESMWRSWSALEYSGQLLATILRNTPELRGVLFDQPAGVAEARDMMWSSGVADRCDVTPGDFFAGVPVGGDAYLLKSVIHNWDDDKAATILRNCRKAMGDKGTLLLVERVMPPRVESPMFGRVVWSDVNMLVNTFGRERTEAEYDALLARAGFELTGRKPTSDNPVDYQLLEGVPA